MGDSSDNVPGVPGVGPKTAAALISEHGCLEKERWDCWFGYDIAGADCVFWPVGQKGGREGFNMYPGDQSIAWWSTRFRADDVDDQGLSVKKYWTNCATEPDSEYMKAPVGGKGVKLELETLYKGVFPGATPAAEKSFTETVKQIGRAHV